jgi:hypothetical protein
MKRSDTTQPIVNFLFQDKSGKLGQQYLKESMDLMKLRIEDGLSSIQRHKKILGKQKYCWTGFVKHWVWEENNWRAYVSKEGASFEVLESLTLKEAWSEWQDYYKRMMK